MPSFRIRASRLLVLGLALAIASPAPASTFTTSKELSLEAETLVRLLEEMHYNRDAIKTSDYDELIPDYMGELDGQRLFFLASDKAAFTSRYDSNLYYNIRQLGNIDAAYDIFNVYQARVDARVNWIYAELKKDFDLTTQETYAFDRSKAEWPATPADADDLWRRRLKLEILTEMLNQKSTSQTVAKDGSGTTPVATATVGETKVPASVANPAPKGGSDQAAQLPDQAKTIAAAKEIVRKRYERMLKNINETDGDDLAEAFLSSVTLLYDPHSTYFSADDFEDFNIQMRLSLIGIGAMLDIEDDYCVVKEILPGGAADLSKKIQPNDKIISVTQPGGEPVDVIGRKLHRIVNLIRGLKGTQVRLTIIPADATDQSTRKEVLLTRDVVKLNSVRAHAAIFDVPSADGKSTTPIGVISLPSFYGPTDSEETASENISATKDIAKLIKELQAAGIKGIVLDLRSNGGGLLSEAITIAGLFIGHGPIVQVKDYQGDIKVENDDEPSIAYAGPLAVLVNRFSASASEIVAGALQDYGRAIVIGDDSTHGKGTVQTLVEMKTLIPQLENSDLKTGAAKITFQKFYLPDGSSTQLRGVVSDISLPSIDDYLPIGEKSLPHALVWDEIPTSFFDGARLNPNILKPLRDASLARQQKLEEFAWLKKSIDWFKAKEEEKRISLNLVEREKEKAADDAFNHEMKAEKTLLAKNDFKYREFRLGPPPPPKPPETQKTDGTDDDTDMNADENESYVPLDIPLRESLRVVNDALALGHDPKLQASDHAPLAAVVDNKN
ncbi:MAG TPA: carboxy terminal-processing peptidase [Opitutaceae bacterium]|nr:carboxy terminal-processing peptidase [Opitutaceae bacterium]